MIPRAARARPAALVVVDTPRATLLLVVLLALTSCGSSSAPRGVRSAQSVSSTADEEPVDETALPPPQGERSESAGRATAPATGPVYQRGIATYYADSLSGHPTATGEPYNPNELTAAHKTLPLGAIVNVARTDGRYVTVRINDRGPYGKGRIIDLSRRAAHEIGLLNDGVAKVLLRVLSVPPKSAKAPAKRRRPRR